VHLAARAGEARADAAEAVAVARSDGLHVVPDEALVVEEHYLVAVPQQLALRLGARRVHDLDGGLVVRGLVAEHDDNT
jgi:hypothetical protein